MAFCGACNQKIEWHQTVNGRNIAIDPEPHPEGNYAFDGRLRLALAAPRSKARMYRCHFDTCPKKGQVPRRAGFSCDRNGCDRSDRHFHCRRCGATDHFVAECPE